MWTITNHGLMSVVKNRSPGFEGTFLVRARRAEDLYHFFGNEELVKEHLIVNPEADYEFRVIVDPDTLKGALSRQVDMIDYGNFKSSVPANDYDLNRFVHEVWASGAKHLASERSSVSSILRLPISQRSVAPASSVNTREKVKSRP
jgi:hypothetical protein